jgi:hypothetical protein
MNPKLMMFATFVFLVGSLCCLFIEGSYIGSGELSLANSLTGYNVIEVSSGGAWSFAKIATGFLTHGIPKLIMWDYNFFQGGYFIIRLFLIMTLSVMVVWGIIQVMITAAQSIIGWIRGLL